MTAPYLLLPYQVRLFSDNSRVVVVEKSRRIGATYALACKAVDQAVTDTRDTWYLSYSEDAGIEFIRDCAHWARVYQKAHVEVTLLENFDHQDGTSESIKVQSIQFANGRRISALSSAPRSLRGKQGMVILDEAAFADDLPELLTSAMALLMWGGQVVVLSTHKGTENPFAELVEDVRTGERPGSLHTITLDDALRDGLYERICLVTGQPWSPEAQEAWRTLTIKEHGLAAHEELFCIPSAGSTALFKRENLLIVDSLPQHIIRTGRAWDFASTAPSKGKDPDWTRGVKGVLAPDQQLIITDVASVQGSPSTVKSLLKATAALDGPSCQIGIWTDPGAAGVYLADDLKAFLSGYSVVAERATKSKIAYATAPANAASTPGAISLLRAPWNEALIAELVAFPSRHAHDDQVDALSRLWLLFHSSAFAVGYFGQAQSKSITPGADPWSRAIPSGFGQAASRTSKYAMF